MTPNQMKFENVEMNIQVLQQALIGAGLTVDAGRLNGIEVRCEDTARMAMEIVRRLPLQASTPKEVIQAQDWAVNRLMSVLPAVAA